MSEDLKKVADLITANTIFCTKEVLTSDEAARYMGVSKSYLYKLTMRQQIPHFKPMGKCAISTVRSWSNGCKAIGWQLLQRSSGRHKRIV